jgi:hypothetical protein
MGAGMSALTGLLMAVGTIMVTAVIGFIAFLLVRRHEKEQSEFVPMR